VGSAINPTGGVANYDVFSNLGNQRGGEVQGASTNNYPGTTWYDATNNTLNVDDGSGNWTTQQANNTSTSPTYTDPYAKWGGQANYNSLINQFNTQKQGIQSSANAAGDQTASQYNRSILDFLDSNRLGQQQIDQRGVNNELAKQQGVQGVLGMVGRGIRSSSTMLNNKNAGDSSAAGAIANAYGQIGRGELANVGNQYEQGNQGIQQDQDAFAVQQASGIRGLQGSKEDSVNAIVNDARNQFAALDAQIAGASLPDRIAIEQEKEAIRSQILGKLQAFDQQLASGVQGIQASSGDQRREKAAQLGRAGTSLGEGAFNFATQAPAQFQGNAPSGGNLPLFTLPRSKRTA
jgi:hypothetical protein